MVWVQKATWAVEVAGDRAVGPKFWKKMAAARGLSDRTYLSTTSWTTDPTAVTDSIGDSGSDSFHSLQ